MQRDVVKVPPRACDNSALPCICGIATGYPLQVVLNVKRQSTVGWSIQNVLLDFTGGWISVAQLLLQCSVKSDFTQIAGNPVKFGLGFVSIIFDVVFMLQHYVIYRSDAHIQHDASLSNEPQSGVSEEQVLLSAGGVDNGQPDERSDRESAS